MQRPGCFRALSRGHGKSGALPSVAYEMTDAGYFPPIRTPVLSHRLQSVTPLKSGARLSAATLPRRSTSRWRRLMLGLRDSGRFRQEKGQIDS